MKHAPANAEKYPSYKLFQGVDTSMTVYVIKGEIYAKNFGIPMGTRWFKIGPAPLF